MPKKDRTAIPGDIADDVLFKADRTCCICRTGRTRLQIHHIDNDPTNHDPANLAVLCLNCHGETEVKGAFGRSLTPGQVTKYRDDWLDEVGKRRSALPGGPTVNSRAAIQASTISGSVFKGNTTVGELGLVKADELFDSEFEDNLSVDGSLSDISTWPGLPLFAVNGGSGRNLETVFSPSWRITQVNEPRVPNLWWRFRGPRFPMDWRHVVGTQVERTSISNTFDLTQPLIEDDRVAEDQVGLELKFQWRGLMCHELHSWPLTKRVTSKVQWVWGQEQPTHHWTDPPA
jgi:hypothetical protein